MSLLIKNGRVINPASNSDQIMDILIQGKKIVWVKKSGKIKPGRPPSRQVKEIDAREKIVVPGLFDLHTHLREPGDEYKETIKSGSLAAVKGGFTSVCCMPNTRPVNDNSAVTSFILKRAREAGGVNVYPVGAISKGLQGKELAEMGDLKEAGAVAFSDDGKPVRSGHLMRRALEYASLFKLPLIAHCEDLELSQGGVIHEGFISTQLGLSGIPAQAEEIMVARDLSLAELTGAQLHFAHISTAGSVRLIREAKKRGIRVSAETTPHHFTLTVEAVKSFDPDTKVNPPLRTQKDIEEIKQGLAEGVIDCIASDHAPHSSWEKETDYNQAPFGISGLETTLGLSLRLMEEKILSLSDLIACLSLKPAKILNLNKGEIKAEADADLTIIDLKKEEVINPANFISRGKNTPFKGWSLKGGVIMTIREGKIVYPFS